MRQCIIAIFVMLTLLMVGTTSSVAGLTFYYDFEEIKDGAIPDRSGNGLNGKIVGDVTLDGGKVGKAARFKNKGYLDLNGAKVPANLIPSKGFSLLAWVNVEADGDQAIFNAWAADNTWLIHPEVRPGGGYYRWTVRTDGGVTIGEVKKGKPVKNEWHHFAAIYDSVTGVATLYIDGVEVGKDARAGSKGKTVNSNWDKGARVGYNVDNGRNFTGRMDEVGLWDEALALDQVKKYMDGLPQAAVDAKGKLASKWGRIKSLK
ncbi:TPA: LamG domain-containing protein [Candidatus Poribacteria bacterium]|nr:LamG domain-containing protein [Candidatus Poribacteria bacterium]